MCASCHYWEKFPVLLEGRCRQDSPKATPRSIEHLGNIDREAMWPITQISDWCGKHQEFTRYAEARESDATERKEAFYAAMKAISGAERRPSEPWPAGPGPEGAE